jgi:RNA polymerase sigma-54 factor
MPSFNYQKEFFLTGDEQKIRPMVLRDIASIIQMDISTVSRVANSKYVETPYGTRLIKSFFSEGVTNSRRRRCVFYRNSKST